MNEAFENESPGDDTEIMLDEQFGTPVPAGEETENLINQYEKIRGPIEVLFFNVLTSRGSCGFASSGANVYLVNTDRQANYDVTIRVYWQRSGQGGSQDRIVSIAAGGQAYIGCTVSQNIPITYLSYQVVGEVRR